VAGIPNQGGKPQFPATELRFNAEQIVAACNDFYRPILEAEMVLMRERKYLDPLWEKSIQQILVAAHDKMQRGEAFLLRVGRHSGAESVTLNGVRQIKIMKGKGEQPEHLDAAKTPLVRRR
jgi:CRISPR-associated protein Csm5